MILVETTTIEVPPARRPPADLRPPSKCSAGWAIFF